jgi:hypothetical protein
MLLVVEASTIPLAARCAAPRADLAPFAPFSSDELQGLAGGDREVDDFEGFLARMGRVRGATDVAIAEGLHALRKRDRLARLGCHLDDYAREVLDVGRRTAEELARLGRELSTRPLLREAVRSGRVGLRAAQTVLEVARGEHERLWVERAESMTVRALEELVRGATPGDDEPWHALRAGLDEDERATLDEALELAGELMPGSTRMDRVEAIAQEFAATCPADPDATDAEHLREFPAALRRIGAEEPSRDRAREAALEVETDRWAALAPAGMFEAPELGLDDAASAAEVDARLRELARVRSLADDVVGHCALALKRARVHLRYGFASFRHYCEERLGLPARAIEERARVEERRWASAALRDAKAAGLPYEKLRLLARLPEDEIRAWTPRALELTCIGLRRALEGEREGQMRAQRRIRIPLPLRVAGVLAAALRTVRDLVGRATPIGTCLALLAGCFLTTWRRAVRKDHGVSRKVRDRDHGECQVPGCSHRAQHAHHVVFRSRGGGDEQENQIALCAFHHLRCVHGGYLRAEGRAPELRWVLGGVEWRGPRA